MPGGAKEIKPGHNSILTEQKQTPPKLNLYEKEKQFLVEPKSQEEMGFLRFSGN